MCGADELCDFGAQIVFDVDRVETDAATSLVGGACRDELLALRRREEADRAVDRNGRLVIEIGDDRHGEICQREHRATHHSAICVQMIRRDGHFADGMVRAGFDDRALRLSSESILCEVRPDLFKGIGFVYHSGSFIQGFFRSRR